MRHLKPRINMIYTQSLCGNQNQSEEAPTFHAQTQKCVHTLLYIHIYIYVYGIYIVVYISVYLLYICSWSLSLPTSSNMHYLDISIIYSTRIATCSSPPPPSHTHNPGIYHDIQFPSLPSSPPSCLVCCLSLALAATFALPFALLQIGFHHNNVLRGGVYNPNTSVYTCPLSCSPLSLLLWQIRQDSQLRIFPTRAHAVKASLSPSLAA